MRRLAAVLLAAGALAAGCTSHSSPSTPTTSTELETVTQTRPPTVQTAPPVSTGPTTSADAGTCPLLEQQYAAETVGMRLDRISVQKSGGKVVGCRLYALEHPNAQCDASCLAAEKLPPGDQPAVEITSARYPDETTAHNAFILIAKQGSNLQRDTITSGNIGLCYQTDFYAKDNGTDWACTYSVGTTVVTVKTVVTSPASNAVGIAKAVAGKL